MVKPYTYDINDVSVNVTWNQTEISGPSSSGNSFHDDCYFWVTLPLTPSGEGNISISIKNESSSVFPVSWKHYSPPKEPPEYLSFSKYYFEYWSHSYHLNTTIFQNGAISFYYYFENRSHESDTTIKFTRTNYSSIWDKYVDYLAYYDAINWQSWSYPVGPSVGDWGPGIKRTINIHWNNSFETSCSTIYDDDSIFGFNYGIVLPSTMEFINTFEAFTNTLLNEYQEDSSITSSTELPMLVILMTLAIIFIRKNLVLESCLTVSKSLNELSHYDSHESTSEDFYYL